MCAVSYVCVHSQTVGQTAALGFMNITPDKTELGYVQIYVLAPNNALVLTEVK